MQATAKVVARIESGAGHGVPEPSLPEPYSKTLKTVTCCGQMTPNGMCPFPSLSLRKRILSSFLRLRDPAFISLLHSSCE
jgi:hypothetical protein